MEVYIILCMGCMWQIFQFFSISGTITGDEVDCPWTHPPAIQRNLSVLFIYSCSIVYNIIGDCFIKFRASKCQGAGVLP